MKMRFRDCALSYCSNHHFVWDFGDVIHCDRRIRCEKNAIREDLTQAGELAEKGMEHLTNKMQTELETWH